MNLYCSGHLFSVVTRSMSFLAPHFQHVVDLGDLPERLAELADVGHFHGDVHDDGVVGRIRVAGRAEDVDVLAGENMGDVLQ